MTKADWSLLIIPGQDLGIKLQGLLGWLGNYGHLPYEKQQELLWELGEVKIGVGTLVKTNQRISQAIKKSVTSLNNWVISSQPPLNIDETPWSVKGVKEWLWVFTNPQFCLFRAGDTRGREEIKAQIGAQYSGVIISDDFNVYNGVRCEFTTKMSGTSTSSRSKISQNPWITQQINWRGTNYSSGRSF